MTKVASDIDYDYYLTDDDIYRQRATNHSKWEVFNGVGWDDVMIPEGVR